MAPRRHCSLIPVAAAAVAAMIVADMGPASAQTRRGGRGVPAAPARPAPAAVAAAPATSPAGPSAPGGEAASASVDTLEAKMQQAMSGAAGGLTADDVAKRAEATSPDIVARSRAVEVADAQIEQSSDQFFPKLQGSARYTRLSPYTLASLGSFLATDLPPGPVTTQQLTGHLVVVPFAFPVILDQYALSASLNIPISDYLFRLSHAVSSAKAGRRGAVLDERAARLQVAANGRLSYYEWIRAVGQRFVAQQSLEQARGHRVDSQRAFDVGMVSKADVLRAESQVKTAELLVARTESAVAIAEERLRITMHDPPSAKYTIGENALTNIPPITAKETQESLQAEALDKRLEIRSLDESEYSLRETATLQRVGNYPRLDVQGTAQYSDPNQRFVPQRKQFDATWDASLILSWTPTDILLNNATASVSEARATQVAAQKASLRDSLRTEVTQAYQALKVAETSLETTQSALTASEESYRVRRDLYRNGRATSVEVTDAETELTQARFDLINARIDLRAGRVRLEHATGRDVREPRNSSESGAP